MLPTVQHPLNESSRVAVLDWDGVCRSGFLLFDWLQYLHSHRQFNSEALDLIVRQLSEYRVGAVSYAQLSEQAPGTYATGLIGYSEDRHESLADEFLTTLQFRSALTGLGKILFCLLIQRPAVAGIIVSGGPATVLKKYARSVRINEIYGVKPEVQDGLFSGRLLDNPASAGRKQAIISDIRRCRGVALGVGDSLSDLPMLAVADYRIAVGEQLIQELEPDRRTLRVMSADITEIESARVIDFLRKALH